MLINTSPEPFTNWTASILEDFSVVAGLLVAVNYPIVFLVLLVLFLLEAKPPGQDRGQPPGST